VNCKRKWEFGVSPVERKTMIASGALVALWAAIARKSQTLGSWIR
jgi:hypothetical protein